MSSKRRKPAPGAAAAAEVFRRGVQKMADQTGKPVRVSFRTGDQEGPSVTFDPTTREAGDDMFDVNLECGIKSVTVKVKDVDGHPMRRCRIVLTHEFTKGIARALGRDALAVLTGLESNGIAKAQLPIDALSCMGAFKAHGVEVPDGVSVGSMNGIKATCQPATEDGENPSIHLEFDFAWDESAWVFLGKHCAAVADVVLTKRQTELPFAVGADN